MHADKTGRLSLTYEDAWRTSPQGYSLSVSMPLADVTYPQKSVWPNLWNFLPENPNVLQRWAQQYHVSTGNPFKLLAHVGADVPGAAQFIPPERLAEIHSEQHPSIEWVENEHPCQDIAARLGMPAARSFVLTLDQPYIVVERYDRLPALAGNPIPTTHSSRGRVSGPGPDANKNVSRGWVGPAFRRSQHSAGA